MIYKRNQIKKINKNQKKSNKYNIQNYIKLEQTLTPFSSVSLKSGLLFSELGFDTDSYSSLSLI